MDGRAGSGTIIDERRAPETVPVDAPGQQRRRDRPGRPDRPDRWPLLFGLSGAIGLVLLVQLVNVAGAWTVAANTRFLDLLIRGGVVQLTDMDAGYIAGVPEAELYLRSQSPIDWLLLLVAGVLCAFAWWARAARFAVLAGACGVQAPVRRLTSLGLGAEVRARFLPFDAAERRLVGDLGPAGGDADAARAAVIAHRTVALLEIGAFAVVGALLVGLAVFVEAAAWGAMLLLVAVLLTREPGKAARRRDRTAMAAAARHSLGPAVTGRGRLLAVLVTFAALPLEEIAGYLVVQALSSELVILGGVTPSVVLVALVAGKAAAAVPVTPGGIGQFEWAFAAALYVQGQGLAEAVTVTLVFSAVRYLTAGILLGAHAVRARVSPVGPVAGAAAASATQTAGGNGAGGTSTPPPAPTFEADRIVPLIATPGVALLARRVFVVAAVLLGLHLLGRLRLLLVDYWLLESLGFESVFWTNLRMQALLFVVGGAVWATAVLVPALRFAPAGSRRRWRIAVGVAVGVFAGVQWAGAYQNFLLFRHGRSFSEDDPVFGHDIGFYLFDLPALRSIVWGLALALAASIVVAVVLLYRAPEPRELRTWRARARAHAGRMADPVVLGTIVALGVVTAVGVWLRRFDILVKDNYGSSIPTGAEALDVGFVSTAGLRSIEALAVLFLTAAVVLALLRCRTQPPAWARRGPRTRVALAAPLAVVVLASAGLALRDATDVTPNEPIVQLEHLQRHIDATNRAWGMDQVEIIDADFNGPGDPLPDLDDVLAHPSVANAQLWPGAVSWLERVLDPQHVDRLYLEIEERSPDLVFAASLDTFRQQQKLRPYYDFLDVDVVNYPESDGTPRLTTTAVRELPLLEPQPWLAFWGQRFVLFTHGYGLVAAPMGEVGANGDPVYVSSDVPPVADLPQLEVDDHAVYYGEGSGTIGFSNVRDLPEFDYPTEQSRADIFLPEDVDAGIRLDSPLKRLAFAWGTQEFFDPRSIADIFFSDLITDETRVHVRRQPLDRIEALAPFLYLDSDPYAVAADRGITWIVNGMTVADRYPYSAMAELGDKSVRRGTFPTDVRSVNYAADSVKATVDAYTGQVHLYQVSDEPVVSSWAAAYPDLFEPADAMPEDVRDQLQFPTQLFHVQFDDLWIYYHMTDPVAFFNQEDLFDDADEVLGPMLEPGKGITFSIEPYPTVVETGAFSEEATSEHAFAMSQVFTPEGARNLRSIITVFQGGEDYGHMSMLQLPKGSFVTGPEQAESIIDQTDDIAQQFGFWNSTGVEVIRGYLTPLVVEGEVLYVEPVFIRSAQNPFPQLTRVVVVLRGQAAMDTTLEGALERVYEQLE